MKKVNKIFISLALVLVLVLPLFLGGCFGGSKEKLELHTEFKTEYNVGDVLDLTNGKIKYTNEKGEIIILAITPQMVSSFNTDTVGTREMIITYEEKSILVSYFVVNPFKIKNAVYHCQYNNGTTDLSLWLKFEAPNIVSMGQGDYGSVNYVFTGTYTKSYINDIWSCVVEMQNISQSDIISTGTITNITTNSFKFTPSGVTQTYIFTLFSV